MRAVEAPAKINLALVVGPLRPDGKHEVATVLQPVALADRLTLELSQETVVTGFPADSLARAALERLAAATGAPHRWALHIEKSIPVAAGLGGGSSDAAVALRLANETLDTPLGGDELAAIAAGLGADVPFFLRDRPQLATGDGSVLEPLALPQDFTVVLAWPRGTVKSSTASVYRAFGDRGGEQGFEQRRVDLEQALAGVRVAADLAALPGNDLVSSPLAGELSELGAFRADVTGAGPVVYGLFLDAREAQQAIDALPKSTRSWITRPF